MNIGEVNDLKLRPIIAGPTCLTNRLSNLIDIILKPIVKHVPSFLKDTTDFLKQIPSTVPDNTVLVSFDVESLYSNISHTLGIEAISYWIDKYKHEIPTRFSKDFIIDSLRFILENNTFQFNNEFYRQTKGTAMGTKVAPTYATLTIGYLENILYEKVKDNFGTEFSDQFQNLWKRFLDDCFIPWSKSKEDIDTLHNILNNLNEHLKFTIDSSDHQLPFLDCMVIKNGNLIETDIFYKPTDSKTYLLFTSCHPKHTKVSIPFSLARRLRTIISNEDTFDIRAQELEEYLIKQKYPKTLIQAGIQKAKSLHRTNLLNEINPRNNQDAIAYVSTYNPRNPEIFGELRRDIDILKRDSQMKSVLKNYKIIKSKRQPPNLKRLLTKAKFEEMSSTPKVYRCNRPNCGLCKYLIKGDRFTFKCGKTTKINQNTSCDAKNVIYTIICNGCNEEYIGETKELRKRMTVHRQHIRDPNVRKLRVSGHIDQCTSVEPKFRVFPIFRMNSDSIVSRRQKEKVLIKIFTPKLN